MKKRMKEENVIAWRDRKLKKDDEEYEKLKAQAINAKHGLPLSPKDRAHCFLMGRKLKIPILDLAETLGMSKDEAEKFLEIRQISKPKKNRTLKHL